MDFKDKIESIHETMCKLGWKYNASRVDELAPFYSGLGLDKRLPDQISKKEFDLYSGQKIFSGAKEYQTVLPKFLKGDFRKEAEHTSINLGHGYYFTTDLNRAKDYAYRKALKNVIVAKLKSDAKSVRKFELDNIMEESLPKSEDAIRIHEKNTFEEKMKLFNYFFNDSMAREYEYFNAIQATVFGFDAIIQSRENNQADYLIINRKSIFVPPFTVTCKTI